MPKKPTRKQTTKTKNPGPRTPQLRTHKRSQRCYVTLSGQTFWCGAASDPGRLTEYAEQVRAWEARGRQPRVEEVHDSLTVGALADRYRAHRAAEKGSQWLVAGGGGCRVHYALEAVKRLYGHEQAAEFGPRKLKNVRAAMIAGGQWPRQKRCCRLEANARTRELQSMFRWAASEELVAPAVSHGVACVAPLGDGDQTAHDNPARTAADPAAVAATLPYLPPIPRVIVRLLQQTGARPSEIMRLRAGDIDTSDAEQWTALLQEHKTSRKGKARVLVFEAEAIALLRPFLRRRADTYLFRPAENERQFRQRLSHEFAAARGDEPPATAPSAKCGRTWRPHYDANALRLAVGRAVAACNRDRKAQRLSPIAAWSPYGLRHLHATMVALVATEAESTVLLGHAQAATTTRYLHAEVERAKRASRRVRELREQKAAAGEQDAAQAG